MSIHGNQKILPFILDKNNHPIEPPADQAIALKKVMDQKKEGESLITFSRLAWPLILIHGDLTAHLVIDDVGICDMDIKITNAPRQATVGHILRNIDTRTYEEMLDRIKQVILYTEKGKSIKSEAVTDEEEEEFKTLKLKGAMSPVIIKSLSKMIRTIKSKPIKDYALLESQYSVEIGLNLAAKYKDYLSLIRGNRVRWESLKGLIQEPFDRWIKELNAQIKDTELRYKSNLNKEQKQITKEEAASLLAEEKDKQAQINLQKKKNILEKMGGSFLGVDSVLEDLRAANRKFLNTDSFKLIQIDKAINAAQEQIENLKKKTDLIKEKLVNLEQSTQKYIQKMKEIDEETAASIRKKEVELNTRLLQKNSRIKSISEASETYIKDLQAAKKSLQDKLDEIKVIIENKMKDCEEDLKRIKQWGMKDEISGISQSVLRIFLPVFGGLFEDDDMNERLIFVFPQKIDEDGNLTVVEDGFTTLKESLEEIVDNDMKIRSNFEFTMEKMNLLLDEKAKKRLNEGFKLLEPMNVLNENDKQICLEQIQD